MLLRSVAASLMMLGLFVLVAHAEEEEKGKKKLGKGGNPEELFQKLDANGDKKVTKEEFTKGFEEMAKGKGGALGEKIFEQLDANSDGSLTLDEFKKISEIREKMGKGKLDSEKLKELKGKIDPDKLKELKEKFGDKIDKDKLKELIQKRKAEKDGE
jgi:Ca2+-binding EF-hand superfamily protein